jgi:glycosyltransferase involved in cell wall biosynthesis
MQCIRYTYGCVHCVEEAGLIGALIKQFRGYRFVYEKHSDAASYRRGWLINLALRLYELTEALVIQRADVIFAGRGLVNQIRAADPAARIQTVDNIPTSRVEPHAPFVKEIRARLGITRDQMLATYVGTFAPYQGVDLLIEAIPLVVQRGQRVKFLIVGGTSAKINAKKRQLAAQGVSEAVTFLKPIHPDVAPHYLAASEILLAPRQSGRTVGTKLLDYARAGRAIVATNHASNRKILTEATGLLVPSTPEAFAEGIIRLAEDPDLRNRLAGNARRIIEGRYNYNCFIQWIKSGYAMMDFPPANRVKFEAPPR